MTLDSNCSEFPNNSDTISRQAAIDAVDSETVSTNPEHFESSEKFIKFMDDVDIASFGKWQWANGFNTALVATRVQLKKLSSAEPERKKGEWIEFTNTNHTYVCSVCGRMLVNITDGKNTVTKNYPFCHCGADMRGGEV